MTINNNEVILYRAWPVLERLFRLLLVFHLTVGKGADYAFFSHIYCMLTISIVVLTLIGETSTDMILLVANEAFNRET